MKRFFAVYLLLILFSCGERESTPAKGGVRIVSLAPNITEILFAIGAGDQIAGVTRYCDFPEEAKKKKKIGGILDPDIEAILSLSPDYVLFGNHTLARKFSPILIKGGVKTLSFEADTVEGLLATIRGIGGIAGKRVEADQLADNIRKKLEALKKHAGAEPLMELKTAVVVGHDPLVLAGKGSFPSRMISLLGLKNIAEEGLPRESHLQTAYPVWSVEDLMRGNPDLIIDTVEKEEGSFIERYFKGKRVIYQPSSGIIRPGPRTADSLEEILLKLKSY